MPLTSPPILNAKPQETRYLQTDGNGLHIQIDPNGSKHWRLRYRCGGKQSLRSLGSFPEVSLALVRTKRDDARKVIAEGNDSSQKWREDKLAAAVATANTFGAIAQEHIADLKESGKAQCTIDKNVRLLEDLAAPPTKRPFSEITPAELLDLLKKVGKSGRRKTARRLPQPIPASHWTARR
jgi:hypothetical protein